MPKRSQAVLVFSAAMFVAALVPCLMFRSFFARFDESVLGFVASLLWWSLPVLATVWSGAAASYFIRRRGSIGFWRGAATGIVALLGCSLLWSFVMTTVSGNPTLNGFVVVVVFALAIFGMLAAGVGGISGWLTSRLLRNEPA